MRYLGLTLLLSLLSTPLLAQTVQFKGASVAIGDPVAKLLKQAGKPDQVRPFPGSTKSTLYEYSVGNRQINITVRDGKVAGIADNTIAHVTSPRRPSGVQLKGGRIVSGDSLQTLQQVGGKPTRVRTFPDMAVYEYSLGGREVTVTVRNGKVSGTSELKVTSPRRP